MVLANPYSIDTKINEDDYQILEEEIVSQEEQKSET